MWYKRISRVLFYLLVFVDKYQHDVRAILLTILSGLILFDIFFSTFSSDIRTIVIIILGFIIFRQYKVKKNVIYYVALLLILITAIFFLFPSGSRIMERLAQWIYIFILIGLFVEVKSLRVSKK